MEKIKILDKFKLFEEHYAPRIIGELNDNYVKIAKIKDEFIWHNHPEEDEMFLVFKGTLIMDFRDQTVELQPGEMIVVPRGVEHRPRTNGEEVYIMMIEPKSTLNTGNVENERTVTSLHWI